MIKSKILAYIPLGVNLFENDDKQLLNGETVVPKCHKFVAMTNFKSRTHCLVNPLHAFCNVLLVAQARYVLSLQFPSRT